MKILNYDYLQPDRLSKHMHHMLQNKSALKILPIDMNGEANSANFLSQWVNESIMTTPGRVI